MNFVNEDCITLNRVSITNLLQEIGPEDVRNEIISGLSSTKKFISSKFFYNLEGSQLFETITGLDEYYPTRTEMGILKRIGPAIMKCCRGYDIIELGSGDNSKISVLFQAATELSGEAIHYMPLDISQSAINASARGLVRAFPNINIEGYAVDFISQFDLLKRDRPALICFFGSTIGNFEWNEAIELLKNISSQMKPGDRLLLGMDLVKQQAILNAAYNDAQGVTAAFNRNILNTVNEMLDSDFNPIDFDHLAYFNSEKSRMEMYLVANRDLTVQSPFLSRELEFSKGESIHTENSHKYSREDIREIACATGLHLDHTHTDGKSWFMLADFQK